MKKLLLLTLISSFSLCLSQKIQINPLEYNEHHFIYPLPPHEDTTIRLHIIKESTLLPNIDLHIPMNVVDGLNNLDPNVLLENGNELFLLTLHTLAIANPDIGNYSDLIFLTIYTLCLADACLNNCQSIAFYPTITNKSLQKELIEAGYNCFNNYTPRIYRKNIPAIQTMRTVKDIYLVFDEQEDFDLAIELFWNQHKV